MHLICLDIADWLLTVSICETHNLDPSSHWLNWFMASVLFCASFRTKKHTLPVLRKRTHQTDFDSWLQAQLFYIYFTCNNLSMSSKMIPLPPAWHVLWRSIDIYGGRISKTSITTSPPLFSRRFGKPEYPCVPGHELAGVVKQIGSNLGFSWLMRVTKYERSREVRVMLDSADLLDIISKTLLVLKKFVHSSDPRQMKDFWYSRSSCIVHRS